MTSACHGRMGKSFDLRNGGFLEEFLGVIMAKKDPYVKRNREFDRLLKQVSRDYKPILFPPLYARLVQDDLSRFLILLSRYKFMCRMISKTDQILEIGSGSGLGAIFLGQYCRKVVGLEVKDEEIAYARSLNRRKNVVFFQKDFLDFKHQELFDVVINLDVIEHMPEAVGKRLLAKTTKHLKSNGMMILGTPSIYSYPYQGKLSRAAHVKCYDQEELIRMVQRYYGRVIAFSMNDEVIHTGFPKLAWYYFILAFCPKTA